MSRILNNPHLVITMPSFVVGSERAKSRRRRVLASEAGVSVLCEVTASAKQFGYFVDYIISVITLFVHF